MIQTGIFGGSFNPIHNGHIHLARLIADTCGLDEVWFMVSPQNPLKPAGGLLDDRLRLKMAEAALRGEDRLKACSYEFGLPRPSYTWNTLQHLSHDYPDRRFTLIIGGDNWACFDRWAHAAELKATCPIIVYPRNGSTIDTSSLPESIRVVRSPLLDISSTEVRRKIAAGESIGGLVPESVEEIIRREGLYGYPKR